MLDLNALSAPAGEPASVVRTVFSSVGRPLTQHSQLKSAGALSRFLNHYGWPTRQVIRSVQSWVLEQLLAWAPQGQRPHLQLIVDLTTLDKTGKFQQMPGLVRWYNRKRGLHLVVLYLVVGQWRIPWSFRIYQGKGSATLVQLALRLLSTLPPGLQQRYEGRWAIEGFFKVTKHRFGMHRFSQSSPEGVYRWLVLVLIAFVLALCGLLMQQIAEEVDWAIAAQTIVRLLIPHIVIYSLLKALEPLCAKALALGIELPNTGW